MPSAEGAEESKVSKAFGLATDLTNTSVRSASSVLPNARWTLSPNMTVVFLIRFSPRIDGGVNKNNKKTPRANTN